MWVSAYRAPALWTKESLTTRCLHSWCEFKLRQKACCLGRGCFGGLANLYTKKSPCTETILMDIITSPTPVLKTPPSPVLLFFPPQHTINTTPSVSNPPTHKDLSFARWWPSASLFSACCGQLRLRCIFIVKVLTLCKLGLWSGERNCPIRNL